MKRRVQILMPTGEEIVRQFGEGMRRAKAATSQHAPRCPHCPHCKAAPHG